MTLTGMGWSNRRVGLDALRVIPTVTRGRVAGVGHTGMGDTAEDQYQAQLAASRVLGLIRHLRGAAIDWATWDQDRIGQVVAWYGVAGRPEIVAELARLRQVVESTRPGSAERVSGVALSQIPVGGNQVLMTPAEILASGSGTGAGSSVVPSSGLPLEPAAPGPVRAGTSAGIGLGLNTPWVLIALAAGAGWFMFGQKG